MGTYIGSKNTNCLTYTPKNVNLSLASANVSMTGALTNNNGIFSGFGSANYISLLKTLPLATASKIEIVVRVKSSSLTGNQAIVANSTDTYGGGGFVLRTNGGARLYCWGTNNNTSWGLAQYDTGIDLATDYRYLKILFTPTSLAFAYSTDNSSWTNGNSVSIGGLTNMSVRLGITGTTAPLNGSIDLVNSYIKVNDSVWWKGGTGTLTLKAGSKVYIPNGFDAVRYYKYTYATWTRPNLTAEGTLGGDSFAVAADTVWSGYPIYQAVDGNDSTRWLAAKNSSNSSFIFYNPKPLKVTKIVVTKQHTDNGIYASAGDIFGSNDNSNWQKLGSFTGGTYNNGFACDLSSNTKAYKYHKITPTATVSAGWGISELQITATQQTGSVESTSTDYDYTVGAGQPKFDEVTVGSDMTTKLTSNSTSRTYTMTYSETAAWDKNLHIDYFSTNAYSGTTKPENSGTGSGNWVWYDTANNKMMTTSDGGATWVESRISLPFGLATGANSTVTALNQTFDWCGYIGGTAFVLPGVKGLIPNGWNSDGTYKSIEFEIPNVSLMDYSTYSTCNCNMYLNPTGLAGWIDTDDYRQETFPSGKYNHIYIPSKNEYWYNKTGDYMRAYDCLCGTIAVTSGTITSLTPYTAQKTTTFIPIEAVYNGSTSIGFIYNGSTLVWQHNPYPVGTVLANTRVEGSLVIYPGVYELKIAGAGGEGGGVAVYWGNQYHSGGSGACWEGTFKYSGSPATLSWTTGTGACASVVVSIGGVTQVTAGGGATGSGATGGAGGVLTVESVFSSKIVSTTNASNGNNGAGTSVNWGSSSSPITAAPSSLGWGVGAASNNSGRTEGGFYLKRIN